MNLLGGLRFTGEQNDANKIGTYMSATSIDSPQNFPTPTGWYWLISIGDTDNALCFQISFNTVGGAFYREYWNGWKSWVEM